MVTLTTLLKIFPLCLAIQAQSSKIYGQYGDSPFVPLRNTTGIGGWEGALEKAKLFVSKLTLEEKSDMVTGQRGPCVGNIVAIPRLGFPGLCLQDGPNAIREADYVSVFPAGITIAASFDRALTFQRGVAMGLEFKGKGAHVALGPVGGPIGRSANAGRNWEGFSPDPYLTAILMEETILGTQSVGVQACAKHFIANEQETQRVPTIVNGTLIEAYSSNLDDRTMHELYMWPFANAIRAGVASVMCSYNRVNGSYACQNSKALNGLLKEELGFQGYVVSDWGGTHSGVASVMSGLDMNMGGGLGTYGTAAGPASYTGGNLTQAMSNGTVPISRVDDMIMRVMTPYYYLEQDISYPSVDSSSPDFNTFNPKNTWIKEFALNGTGNRDVRADHGDLIRKIGAASTVLLKNTKNALPLKAPKTIAVFGNDASELMNGFESSSFPNFEYGTLAMGGGSGAGRFSYLITPLEAIKARARKDGSLVQQLLNNTLIANIALWPTLIKTPPEVCIVFLKMWGTEGTDRKSFSLDWQGDKVVEKVASYCNNTIVVTHSPGTNVLPWADHENVTAILAAHYPGQESGNSIIDILYGDVNPSAKLPYTIALSADDHNGPVTFAVNSTSPEAWQVDYTEKLEIDYRYFDAKNMSVRYEFGYGLSYTTFGLSSLTVAKLYSKTITAIPESLDILPGGNPTLWDQLYMVKCVVKNTGSVAGATVPQLYMTLPSTAPAGTPPKQMRGFEKVYLEVGQSAIVSFTILRRDISYWDIVGQEWIIPPGPVTFSIGFSSRDIKLTTLITAVE